MAGGPSVRHAAEAQNRATFEALGELLDDAFRAMRTDELVRRLREEQVPSAQVHDLDAALADPQVLHNEIAVEWEHPTVGPMRHARPPVRFSDTRHEPVWAVDELGQSTEEVLRSRGFDDADLERLRAAGVIRT